MAKKKKKAIKKSLPKIQAGKAKKIRIRVIGIGGGGCSIVSELASRMQKVSFVVANTDLKALKTAGRKALRFQFGEQITKGWGTGMSSDLGREAALNDKERIKKLLGGFDLCILVSSLGGGTGSGASPIFAKVSRDLGNITYGIFTLPFKFEGEKKMEIAKNALRKIRPKLNIFSVIPNERIFQIINKKTPLKSALSTINKNLTESLEGLIEMLYEPGLINIDFADFRTILTDLNPSSKIEKGKLSYLNTAIVQKQEGVAKTLIEKVLNCPLYPYGIKGAKGILLNIAGEKDLSLAEVSQISNAISGLSNKEAKIIFGISQRKKYSGFIQTTLLAAGIPAKIFPQKPRKKQTKEKIIEKKAPSQVKKEAKKALSRKTKKSKKVKKSRLRSASAVSSTLGRRNRLRPTKSADKQGIGGQAKLKKIKIKIKKPKTSKMPVSPKPEKETSSEGLVEVKIRKNGLQIKKEMEAQEEEMLAKERFWEPPAFLRRKQS